MKFLITVCLTLIPISSFASVDFSGPDWTVGEVTFETIQRIDILVSLHGEQTVILNFINDRQIRLSGADAAVGLSLTSFQGKCIRVIPGQKPRAVSFLLTCN